MRASLTVVVLKNEFLARILRSVRPIRPVGVLISCAEYQNRAKPVKQIRNKISVGAGCEKSIQGDGVKPSLAGRALGVFLPQNKFPKGPLLAVRSTSNAKHADAHSLKTLVLSDPRDRGWGGRVIVLPVSPMLLAQLVEN